jgi:hypothetical protein
MSAIRTLDEIDRQKRSAREYTCGFERASLLHRAPSSFLASSLQNVSLPAIFHRPVISDFSWQAALSSRIVRQGLALMANYTFSTADCVTLSRVPIPSQSLLAHFLATRSWTVQTARHLF